tara:strand:- start:853 stop:1872 length:1020 start_codon:yes stop_codon:yes gene_type:complete
MTEFIIDGATTASSPDGCASEAVVFEKMGLDAAWTFEASHDPFLPLALAAHQTDDIQLGTAIAVAFARNPMTCAVTAWDLQRLSNGRFILGLGTQIKPHITKRYSESWSQPAARMKEYIAALHAIWDNFQSGEKLDFRGEFYTHTLMTPFFSPGSLDVDRPKIYVAGVGPKMVEIIGESADGFFVHPFHTPDHMEAETLPVLRSGAKSAGREASDVTVACLTIVAMGRDDAEVQDARNKAAAQLAFYGSTPAYAGVLDFHGYENLQPELNQLSKQGDWKKMTEKIDDDLVDLLCVSGTPREVGAKLRERNQFADRSTMMFYGAPPDPDAIADTVKAARA